MLITTLYTHLQTLTTQEDMLWKVRDALEDGGASVLAASIDTLGQQIREARLALRTVTPRWNGTEEHWYVIHPDTGAHHTFDLCEESGYQLLQINEPNILGIAVVTVVDDGPNFELGNFLTATLHDCPGQTEFLIADDWHYTFEWED